MRKAQIIVAIVAVLTLGGFTWLAINSGITTKNLDIKTIKLQSTEAKLKDVNVQVEQLKTQSSRDKEKAEQLEKEKKELEAKLVAKAEAKAKLELAAAQAEAKLTATQTVSAKATASLPSGSHNDWMAQAGIAASDYGFVDYIVMHEGHYEPCVVNGGTVDCSYAIPVDQGGKGGQKAYGVCQALPGSKMASAGADWATNPITQLKWCHGYAIGRYTTWANAYNFWINNRWW